MNPISSISPLLFVLPLIVLLIVAAMVILRLSSRRKGNDERLPYVKQKFLLSKAEKSFYEVLLQSIPETHICFPKIRLCDVIEVESGTPNRASHMNRIMQKHLDFVICDRQWIEPRLAIELDDKSHASERRQERDAFLNRACESAGLPLLRIPARRSYNVRELSDLILSHLRAKDSSVVTARPLPAPPDMISARAPHQ